MEFDSNCWADCAAIVGSNIKGGCVKSECERETLVCRFWKLDGIVLKYVLTLGVVFKGIEEVGLTEVGGNVACIDTIGE